MAARRRSLTSGNLLGGTLDTPTATARQAPVGIVEGEPDPGGTGPYGGGDPGNYPPPTPAPPPAAAVGTYMPGGYNTSKWNDPNKHDPKYDVGRILSKYPPTPAGLQQAMAELQAFNPGIRLQGNDTLLMPPELGGGWVDVLAAADAGGQGWWWGSPAPDDGNPTGGGGGGVPGSSGVPGFGGGTPAPGGGGGVPGFTDFGAGESGAIEEIIRNIISGRGALGTPLEGTTTDAITRIIKNNGGLDEGRLNQRIENARTRIESSRRGQDEQMRAQLAAQGLIGTGGEEAAGVGRLSERVGEDFSTALRDIEVAESQAADDRLMGALELATGMGRDQAQTLLGAIGAGNQRQAVLAQVAVEQLKNNTQWNMFLANYGLDRDRLMYEIQNGRMEGILPILSLFLQTIQTGRGGTTPPTS